MEDLQINDVKDEVRFQKTVDRIKKQILLAPVDFGEPKINGHQQITKQVPQNYHHLFGGSKQTNKVKVDFTFSGSPELFGVVPNNVKVPSGRMYQPNGNTISIEVEIDKLDKDKVLSMARQQMADTFAVVKANNEQALQWSQSMESTIDSMLIEKRKELMDFYG